MNNKGLSVIELILFIVIMGIAVPVLMIMASSMYNNTVDLESMHISSNLAHEKMEDLKSRDFSSIVNEAATDFPGQFNSFQYEVTVNYVSSNNLDQPVDPTVTEYKHVIVTVRDKGILGRPVTFINIIAND